MSDSILIKNAHLHNLKNLTFSLPKNKLIVFTGLSGSGKSSLAFDTLFLESQRQFMESLGMLTYALGKPAVDSIEGLMPAISLAQHTVNHSPRSTVGTVTDVYTYLRVLFARLGRRPCPRCGAEVPASHEVDASAAWDDQDGAAQDSAEEQSYYACPACGAPIPELGMASFSFNKPAGACPTCTGLGLVMTPDLTQLFDEQRSLQGGAVLIWNEAWTKYNLGILKAAARAYGFTLDPDQPLADFSPAVRDLLLYGADSPQVRHHFPGIPLPETVNRGRFEGLLPTLLRRQAEHVSDPDYQDRMEKFLRPQVCPDCQGTRLRLESRQVRVAGRAIHELAQMTLSGLAGWLADLPGWLPPEDLLISEPVLSDLHPRLARLIQVGAGYLTMERGAPSLSAGESQRLRLAALLGSGLTGVLYVLDEPTIGLHPRDTERLVHVLRDLRDLGNTVLVIEHDLDMIRSADYVVDIGPGAGRAGGHLLAGGTQADIAACPESLTGGYLSGRLETPLPARRAPGARELLIRGARAHNLKNLDVRIPLGLLVAFSGPSGSGKSTLVLDILGRAAGQRFDGAQDAPGQHDSISGWEHLERVISIDQDAMGRLPRSNAATYTQAFGPIRDAFAALPAARQAGLEARHFSFNLPGGRCERCQGAGVLTVEMHFMPDVTVRCPACRGRRFKREVLAVKYGPGAGLDISEVLDLTIEEALPFFKDVPAAASRLGLMVEVGLGYLQLGQPAVTFSGGEAQRVKLSKELSRKGKGRSLYLLDEPTTGLHPADTAHLLAVLQRLVDAGNSVVVIEHNLDLLRSADWIIDLGPDGGPAGGEIVAQGTPEQIAAARGSATGVYLARTLGLAEL